MYCVKRNRRTFLNFFEVYDCFNCPNYLEDEVIKIGLKSIKIYYLVNGCKFNNYNVIGNNSKTKILFKDIYIDLIKNPRGKNIFLWLNKNDNLSNYYSDINFLLNNELNVYIII